MNEPTQKPIGYDVTGRFNRLGQAVEETYHFRGTESAARSKAKRKGILQRHANGVTVVKAVPLNEREGTNAYGID
jgi:hypothetical protein